MGSLMVAGRLVLPDVMGHLADERQVFHSEADFQFAFAQTVARLDPGIRCRLEVPQEALGEGTSRRGEYLDLACGSSDASTLIEFKYATRGWTGNDHQGEQFRLRHHGAYDLTRRHYVHDIRRLERFANRATNANGLAILLTNERSLWEPAATQGRKRYDNFRIHEGRTVAGTLEWGFGDAPKYNITLDGTYPLVWRNFWAFMEPTATTFRWLVAEIPATPAPA